MTDRPDRPLVVKCTYDNQSRRIAFPLASRCRLDALRARVTECFHLSALGFHFIYTDDDGEDFAIRSEADLTEAILYFVSGDDGSLVSGREGKINVKFEVVVEYDGPSLSDTSSLRSFREEEEGSSAWGSSYYTESYRSSVSGLSSRPPRPDTRASGSGLTVLEDDEVTEYAGSRPAELERRVSRLTLEDESEPEAGPSRPPPPLTGPDSAPAPSLLTHSELGSRWLREQTSLARRKIGTGSRYNGGASRRYDSDEDSVDSAEREFGDLALVKDERGSESFLSQVCIIRRLSKRTADGPQSTTIHTNPNRPNHIIPTPRSLISPFVLISRCQVSRSIQVVLLSWRPIAQHVGSAWSTCATSVLLAVKETFGNLPISSRHSYLPLKSVRARATHRTSRT